MIVGSTQSSPVGTGETAAKAAEGKSLVHSTGSLSSANPPPSPLAREQGHTPTGSPTPSRQPLDALGDGGWVENSRPRPPSPSPLARERSAFSGSAMNSCAVRG